MALRARPYCGTGEQFIIGIALTMVPLGVTLAQLVKASVGQADVQGFEPHLGHN